jgi:hypothetical protein
MKGMCWLVEGWLLVHLGELSCVGLLIPTCIRKNAWLILVVHTGGGIAKWLRLPQIAFFAFLCAANRVQV